MAEGAPPMLHPLPPFTPPTQKPTTGVNHKFLETEGVHPRLLHPQFRLAVRSGEC